VPSYRELERNLAAAQDEISALRERLDHANRQRFLEQNDEIALLKEQVEALQDKLDKILAWAEAYPLAVFPEPDWKRVVEVMKAAGLSLDAVSASNMRHVITKVAEIARAGDSK